MNHPILMLGDLAIPTLSAMQPIQTYAPLGGASVLRTLGGNGIKQRHWRKRATQISANGWLPPGLSGLDYDEPMLLKCIAPISAAGASNSFDNIPEGVRSDSGHTPYGYAYTPSGWVKTTASIGSGSGSVAAVGGATFYELVWYPEFMVFCEPPDINFDRAGAVFDWTLNAEEV